MDALSQITCTSRPSRARAENVIRDDKAMGLANLPFDDIVNNCSHHTDRASAPNRPPLPRTSILLDAIARVRTAFASLSVTSTTPTQAAQ